MRTGLCRSLDLKADPLQRVERSYYDTFDWRVYRSGRSLELEAGPTPRIVVRELATGRVQRVCEGIDMPRFASDLPPGPFRDELEKVISMRALMLLLTPPIDVHSLRRVDAEGKTVLRVVLETLRWPPGASGGPAGSDRRLLIEPVKGYEKAARKARRYVTGKLGLEPASGPAFVPALQAAGFVPGAYTGKLRLHLDPEMRTDAALRSGFLVLLDMMERNVDGIREEIDSEFLHDFRVAVRRSRAALGQIKTVLPQAVCERFKRELRWLGQITGPARDLDVYLLHLDEYESLLSRDASDALTPLRDFLSAHRHAEYEKLARCLVSGRWLRFKAAWLKFMESPVPARTRLANAARLVKSVADERIWRAYKRVRKDGRSIKRSTPVTALHDLRIRGKKLRYLLELFRSLYPRRHMDRLILALKKLQDNLGALQDYAVQAERLSEFGREMAAEGEVPPRTLAALETLAGILHDRERQAREEFASCFAKFDAPPNRTRFKRLLAPAHDAGLGK